MRLFRAVLFFLITLSYQPRISISRCIPRREANLKPLNSSTVKKGEEREIITSRTAKGKGNRDVARVAVIQDSERKLFAPLSVKAWITRDVNINLHVSEKLKNEDTYRISIFRMKYRYGKLVCHP